MERKLAAILCADVYGYSRLMGEDEEATLHTLTSHRKLIDSAIEQHHGRSVIEVAEAGGVDRLEGEEVGAQRGEFGGDGDVDAVVAGEAAKAKHHPQISDEVEVVALVEQLAIGA